MTDITKFREQLTSKEIVTEIEKSWPKNGVQFLRAFLTYQRMQDSGNSSTKIIQCSQTSIYDCLNVCAQLQLMPSKTLNLVHFIPFKNNKKDPQTGIWVPGEPNCTLMIGYGGLIDIALRNDKIRKIEPRLVKEGELYKVMGGTNPSIEHIIDPVSDKEIVAGYAVATLVNGETQFINMSRAEIDDIEIKSRKKGKGGATYQSNFWRDHYGEMAKKTLIRRLFKYLPKPLANSQAAKDYEKVLEIDNEEEYEGGRTIDPEETAGSPDQIMELLEEKEE